MALSGPYTLVASSFTFVHCYISSLGHRLKVFQNRILRKISGLKKDKVIGGKKKLHNEELVYFE